MVNSTKCYHYREQDVQHCKYAGYFYKASSIVDTILSDVKRAILHLDPPPLQHHDWWNCSICTCYLLFSKPALQSTRRINRIAKFEANSGNNMAKKMEFGPFGSWEDGELGGVGFVDIARLLATHHKDGRWHFLFGWLKFYVQSVHLEVPSIWDVCSRSMMPYPL